MGITATPSASITPVANSNAPTSAAGASQTEETAATGFAALLAQLSGGQTAAPLVISSDLVTTDAKAEGSASEQEITNPLLLNDASTVLTNALPFLPPPSLPNTPREADSSSALLPATTEDSGSNTALLGLGLMDNGEAPKLPAQGALQTPLQNASALPMPPRETPQMRTTARNEAPQLVAEKPEPLLKLAETANIAAENTPPEPGTSSFATTLSALTATHAARESRATEQAHIQTPLQSPNWGNSFGDKIVWLAKNDMQSAQISINPPQLGPMQISLTLNGDQASAIFTSAHAEVRQAIESAMPHLREMLSASGITLGDASVGAQLPQQQRESQQHFANGNRSTGENAILPADSGTETLSGAVPIQRGRGLVDLFA